MKVPAWDPRKLCSAGGAGEKPLHASNKEHSSVTLDKGPSRLAASLPWQRGPQGPGARPRTPTEAVSGLLCIPQLTGPPYYNAWNEPPRPPALPPSG